VNAEVNSENALYIAAKNGNTDIVQLLLNHSDIDVNKVNKRNQKSALLIAVDKGKSKVVSILLHDFQTDVNIRDKKENSATSIALRNGFVTSLKLLIRCPKTNLTKELEKVKKYHESNIEEVLVYQTELKTLPSTCCIKLEESLLEAAWKGNFRGIRGLLLCPGININIVDKKGRTPLYLASWLHFVNAVDVLLNATDIDVNKGKKSDGSNPFAIASEEGHFDIMEKLILHGSISEGTGWDSDSWTLQIATSKVTPKKTETPDAVETTLSTGWYLDINNNKQDAQSDFSFQ